MVTEKAYISIHLLVVLYVWSHDYLCLIYGYALGYVLHLWACTVVCVVLCLHGCVCLLVHGDPGYLYQVSYIPLFLATLHFDKVSLTEP